jgi:hypothetical protein
MSASRTVDTEALFRAIEELCRVATQTAGEDSASQAAGDESEKDILSGKHDHAASSDEEWIEAADARPASPSRRREVQLLEEIKTSVKNLSLQVTALKKERRQSTNTSPRKIRDTERAILLGMFPTNTECQHRTKLNYGNGEGHGLKCPDCKVRVFRCNKNDEIKITVPGQ